MIVAVSEWGNWDSTFVQLVDREAVGIAAALVGVAVALGVGALHALGPGHGKAMMAVYLSGAGARPRHAVAVGAAVAVMHTGSVLVVAWTLHITRSMPLGDRLGPALSLVIAVGVTSIGAGLLWRHRHAVPRRRTHAAQRTDTSGGHHHHHQLPEGVSPVSRTGLVLLATSGGLLPSPSAFLLLVTALATGRTAYGLLLVSSFGIGMAVTLTGAGLAALTGRRLLASRATTSRTRSLVARIPLLAAFGVIVGGLLMGANALSNLVF